MSLTAAYLLEVYNFGEVGAGKLVKFPVPAKRQWISLPENARRSDRLAVFTVNGDSLVDIGIEQGDTLLCRRNFEASEITPKRVCIVLLPSGELCAKRLKINDDGTVTIISAFGTEVVFADQIEVQALAIEYKRMI